MDPALLAQAVDLASRQHNAIHLEQLTELGITRRAADHQVTSGRWQRPLRCTYIVTTGAQTWLTQASAALLFSGPGSALARATAASSWGLIPWGRPIHIVRPAPMRYCPRGLIVHSTRHMAARDLRLHRGLWVTSPLRTLLDLADDFGPADLAHLYALSVQKRLVSLDELRARLDAFPRDPFTQLLRSYIAVDGLPRSGVELTLAQALRAAGLRITLNVGRRMRNGRIREADLMVEGLPLIIQIDSRLHHSASANDPDMARDLDWLAIGYTTLRVAAWRIQRDLPAVVAEILIAVAGLRSAGARS